MLDIDEIIKHQIDLELFKKSVNRELTSKLTPLIDDVSLALSGLDGTKKATNTALVEVNKLIDAAFLLIETDLLETMRDWLTDEIPWVADKEELPIEDEETNALIAVILAGLIRGRTSHQWLLGMASSLKTKIRANVLAGITDRTPLSAIIRSVTGTKVNDRRDGLFGIVGRDVSSIASTGIQDGANQAKIGVWSNAGVKKYRWISVLDSRTTAICRSRSNKIYTVGEGPVPPAHIRCRSTIVRYSPSDVVPTSYDEWLRGQPIGVIVDILGKAKAALYLNGKITLDSYVTPTGRELTLKEIKSKLARSQ
jgi:SPP1 gp7 family putative phage head morphogenesis protein